MAGFEVVKVKISEIPDFLQSESFQQFENIPISPLRAASYLANPYAKPDDVVLYLGFQQSKLVAFRTVFPELLSLGSNSVKFIWLSGNWVHPAFRRSGLSTKLFFAIKEDWDYIANTNHSPESKKVYDKTGEFEEKSCLSGRRFYLRFDLAGLLLPKHFVFKKAAPLIRFFDRGLNFINDYRVKKQTAKLNFKSPVLVENINSKVWNFMETHQTKALFRTEYESWNWITSYPWVSSQPEHAEFQKKYPFSVYASDHFSGLFKFENEQGEITDLMWLSIRAGNLTIPYLFSNSRAIESLAAFIVNCAVQKKVNTITVFQADLIKAISHYSGMFWHSKQQTRKFIANKPFCQLLRSQMSGKLIQEGDGDGVFT